MNAEGGVYENMGSFFFFRDKNTAFYGNYYILGGINYETD